ncbi:homeobox domain-containing protein [Burkholderia pseudomallei]|nr:homeobox domain-containing protein [Burkholderia pseudomallei]
MLPTTRKKLRATKDEIGAEYPLAIAMALKDELGGSRHTIKRLARWTGASERTVQNWLSGIRGPSGPHLVALAKHSPAVHFAYLSMTGRIEGLELDVSASVVLLREALALLTASHSS